MHMKDEVASKSARLPRTYRFGLTAASVFAFAALTPGVALAQNAPDQQDKSSTQDSTAATQSAQAQAATTPGDAGSTTFSPSEEIIVTGFRHSLETSINLKRDNDSIVEAVSAEEIGKLPDVSIGESIARLPGIAAQRVGGRAEIISVRGFPPDFTNVLLNGRVQASSGYNRAVEFDQYPSELLSAVVVYKTPDADISSMGLAGTVDLRTIRPLAYGKRTIAINVRGQYDEGGGRNTDMPKWGGRGSISYIDQNKDGTLGWVIGYAHLDSPSHTNHSKNWFYDTYGGTTNLLSGQEVFASNSRDIRDGVMATLEWRPSDMVHTSLDVYYSRFKQRTVNRGAEWFSDEYIDDGTFSNVQTTTIDGNDFGTSGHFDNAVPIIRNDNNRRDDELFSIGWNGEFKMDDRTSFIADLSYSSNKRDETYLETYQGYGVGPYQTRTTDGYDFAIPQDGFPQFTNFGLDYADASQVSLGDRAPWGGWGHDGLLKTPHIKETVSAVDFGFNRQFGGIISDIDVGVNYTHRRKVKAVTELDLFLKNDRDQVTVDPQFLVSPTSLDFAGMGSVLAIDLPAALSTYYDEVQLQDVNHYDKGWGITEDLITLRAKANIKAGNLHGNVGLQAVLEYQSSDGLRIFDTTSPPTIVPVRTSDHYTDVLPSLNLIYDLGNTMRLRFAAAKVMARPRMDDMRANLLPSFNSAVCAGSPGCTPGQEVHPWSANGGNPNLQPWRAKEINLAWDWYGGKATYVSVTGFYVWLDNYIYTQALPYDFSGLPEPATASSIPSNVVVSPIGTLTAPANGQGGYARGIEFSASLEFGKLTSVLDGFGFTGSAAYTDASLKPEAATQIGNLPGLSDWVYNLTGYYEKNGFQARASYRYRSGFKGEVVSLFTNLGYPYILADKQLDAQIGYTFPDGSNLSGLGFQLQVSNVLNSPYSTSYTVNGTQTLETFEQYGRQWLLGVSYKF